MGEMIVAASNANHYDWYFVLAFYAIVFTIGLVKILDRVRDEGKYGNLGRFKSQALSGLVIGVYVLGYVAILGPIPNVPSLRGIDSQFHSEAKARANSAREEYRTTRSYLKERATGDGVWGEIRGEVGGFLFVHGNIYGKIESGKVLTIVYKHPEEAQYVNPQYGGSYLALSKPLKDFVIETISAEEMPYLRFPEAYIAESYPGNGKNKYLVYPWKPHLYLPEGWEILE